MTRDEKELAAYRQLAADVPEYPIGKAFTLIEMAKAAGVTTSTSKPTNAKPPAEKVKPKKVKRSRNVSGERIDEVVDWLDQHPGEWTILQMAKALNRPRTAIQRASMAARQQKRIRLAGYKSGPGRDAILYSAWPSDAGSDGGLVPFSPIEVRA